jgi:hypothetical protein
LSKSDSSTLKYTYEQHDDREKQEDMNESTHGIGRNQTQPPQYQQDDSDGFKHIFISGCDFMMYGGSLCALPGWFRATAHTVISIKRPPPALLFPGGFEAAFHIAFHFLVPAKHKVIPVRFLFCLSLRAGIIGTALRSSLKAAGGVGVRLPVAVFITLVVALTPVSIMTSLSIVPVLHTGIAGLMHAWLVVMPALSGPVGVIVIAGLRDNTECKCCEDYRCCSDSCFMNVHDLLLLNLQ